MKPTLQYMRPASRRAPCPANMQYEWTRIYFFRDRLRLQSTWIRKMTASPTKCAAWGTNSWSQLLLTCNSALSCCENTKRFKKTSYFLPNAPKMKNGKKIAGYFYRFSTAACFSIFHCNLPAVVTWDNSTIMPAQKHKPLISSALHKGGCANLHPRIIYWFAASWAFVSYDNRNKYRNHVAVYMKFRIGMDRRAENNVLSTEMSFWVDTTEWEQGESGNKPLQVQK